MEVFNEARQRQDTDRTALAVERFLVPLLQHVFAFTDLQPCRNPRYLGERRFPLTHEAGFVEQDLADSGFALGENVGHERRRIAHIPLVLTSPDFSLDKSHPAFGDEGRRRSPQGLLQEYLNASPEALWGIVSNGLVLRILRDNPSMTRPAFVEVDLARLFEDDLYSDFVALWLTLHGSRFLSQNGKISQCWLEQWREQAVEEGERAREHLRAGVEQALRALGTGFVAHPANQALREALSNGQLSPNAYFQQLLRLVYRLLFLLTAEDRNILHDPATATAEARRLYVQGYSLSLLRERARKRRFTTAMRIYGRPLVPPSPPCTVVSPCLVCLRWVDCLPATNARPGHRPARQQGAAKRHSRCDLGKTQDWRHPHQLSGHGYRRTGFGVRVLA